MSDMEKRQGGSARPHSKAGFCHLCEQPLDDHAFRDSKTFQWLEEPQCAPKTAYGGHRSR